MNGFPFWKPGVWKTLFLCVYFYSSPRNLYLYFFEYISNTILQTISSYLLTCPLLVGNVKHGSTFCGDFLWCDWYFFVVCSDFWWWWLIWFGCGVRCLIFGQYEPNDSYKKDFYEKRNRVFIINCWFFCEENKIKWNEMKMKPLKKAVFLSYLDLSL